MRIAWTRFAAGVGASAAVVLASGCGQAPQAHIDDARPVALKVGFTKGETLRYGFHFKVSTTATGSIAQAVAAAGAASDSDVSGVESLKVLSVASDGSATVEVRLESIKGTVAGRSLTADPAKLKELESPHQVKISKDGTVLGADGKPVHGFLGDSGLGAGSSALDPSGFGALLAQGKVKPGDSWTQQRDFPLSQSGHAVPGFTGGAHETVKNTFTDYEDLNGDHDAVVDSQASLPVDATFDVSKLFAGFQARGNYGAAQPAAKPVVITLHGTGSGNFRSWFDPNRSRFDKVTGTGQENLTLGFQNIPAGWPLPSGSSSGAITINLDVQVQRQ